MKEKYYFGRPQNRKKSKKTRSYRVIIRKSNSNCTSNFSLWNCNLSLEELKKKFKTILCEKVSTYFSQEFMVIHDWESINRESKSHYIIIQDARKIFEKGKKVNKSLSFGIELHDFDNDEIKNVLVDIFCNKINKGDKNGTEK